MSVLPNSFSNQFLRHQPWPLLFLSAYYSTALPNFSPSSSPSTVLNAASIIFSTFCVTSTCSFSSVTLTYLISYLLPTYLNNSHPLFLWSLLIFLLSCISITAASIQFLSTFSQLNSFYSLLQSLSYCLSLPLHIFSVLSATLSIVCSLRVLFIFSPLILLAFPFFEI